MMLENKIVVVLDIYFVGISFYLIVVIVMICYDLIKFKFEFLEIIKSVTIEKL